MTTRRGFLKFLGTVPVVGAAAAVAAPVETKTINKTAFHYVCHCGSSLIAGVPEKQGEVVSIQCEKCGKVTRLRWQGDHFKTAVER